MKGAERLLTRFQVISTPQREPIASEVAQRIHDALVSKGIPRSKVRATIAQVCGITPQSVFHWYSGRTRMPRADYIAKLAYAFELDLVWLILGERQN